MLYPCASCPNSDYGCFRPIQSVGPAPCPILFLGAGPGKTEARVGIPYSGRAGEELDHTYLPLSGFHRPEVHVGTVTMCWDGTDRTPSDSRVRACATQHLPELLDRVKPEVVVLMGGATCRLADTRIVLNRHHGYPQRNFLLNGIWSGWVVPMYEPALGMRETRQMTQLMQDFRRLRAWREGEWTVPEPNSLDGFADYQLVRDGAGGTWHLNVPWVAVDTESHGPAPWSVQWSQATGQGRVALADDRDSLALLAALLPTVEVILHNAPGDLDTLDRLGIHVTRWRDTMQEAFQLCSLPQGLKDLSYRLFGANMRSWEDVVWPASIDAALAWLRAAADLASTNLSDVETTHYKRGVCSQCLHSHRLKECGKCGCPPRTDTEVTFQKHTPRPGSLESVLRHIIRYTDSTRDDEEPYNPWDAVAKMRLDGLRGRVPEAWEWDFVEQTLERSMPILGIGNCELNEAVQYGAGDADFTGRVAVELASCRGDAEWQVERNDWDA